MISKEQYIAEQHSALLQLWIKRGLQISIVLYYACGVFLDYFTARPYLYEFLAYRLVETVVFLILYLLNNRKGGIRYRQIIVVVAATTAAMSFQAMIMKLGGHSSSYYAGLNLIMIAGLLFVPVTWSASLAIIILIFLVYLLPIALFDSIVQRQVFIGNIIFMFCTAVFAFMSRFHSYNSMLKGLSLEYDLAQERANLERLVDERTKNLRQSEIRYRALFENATDGILVTDPNGNILNANEKACSIYGFTLHALKKTNFERLSADPNINVREKLETTLSGKAVSFETEHYRGDGSRIALEISGNRIKIDDEEIVQVFLRDITEKKRIHDHLVESQKMESIGTLAGGVAHDFRNVITAILGFLDILRIGGMPADKLLNRISVIDKTIRNASSMISKLLGVARKSEHVIVPFNLNHIILDSVKLFELAMEQEIAVSTQLDEKIPAIEGDSNHIGSVLMNLLSNCRDAMPAGGTITIKTFIAGSADGAAGIPPYVPGGEYVGLQVADTGCGIPQDIIGKIFEPFFTTKKPGKGSGLGLAMTYGVVKDHKGYIDVESKVNAGTKFTFYFPACRKATEVISEQEYPFVKDGRETILVVDDEEAVLNFVSDTLEMRGYHVIPADNPLTAMEKFTENADEIDLVVTDVVMQPDDGVELIKHLRTIKPDIKVIMISAYTKFVNNDKIIDAASFLEKPFEIPQLISLVRRVLDRPVRKSKISVLS